MPSTFADDTTSGRWSNLRGSRRVTIVARAEDTTNYDWLLAFKREYLPPGVEAKSTNVLPILDLQPRARKPFFRNVESYSIFIVDLYENRRRLLDGLAARIRPVLPPGMDPYDFILQLPHVGSNAHEFLRQMAINHSVLGRLESLLEWASNPLACEMKREGLYDYCHTHPVELASRAALEKFDDAQLATFLGRLGAAVGDALSPERQAQAILESVEHSPYFLGGYFACRVLNVELGTDRIYDIGPFPVWVELDRAHKRIHDFMTREAQFRLRTLVKRGIVEERASHTEVGLQAADIAAALACREYESVTDDSWAARGRAVKKNVRPRMPERPVDMTSGCERAGLRRPFRRLARLRRND